MGGVSVSKSVFKVRQKQLVPTTKNQVGGPGLHPEQSWP